MIKWFTEPDAVVLDPMSGVGTIPLEARIQGRTAIASDLSDLAVAVSRAKLESADEASSMRVVNELATAISANELSLEDLIQEEHADFGLNGVITDYFHQDTLRELLVARRFFAATGVDNPGSASVLTAILHVLHGNRPYALSRRSHPITPLKPTGEFSYRPLIAHVEKRLSQTLPELSELPGEGRSLKADFGALPLTPGSVDAVITSPPFAQSLRFFSSNWMRLWFCGWSPEDFRDRPAGYLESEQKHGFDDAYRRFFRAMHETLREDGLLVMHVGATHKFDMAEHLLPLLAPEFRLIYDGAEHLDGPESHGLSDKGSTVRHHFLFCRRV
ncbi:hypothetical protein NBH00_06625 [Paraconexibacter antarcticus]|uniref:Site-specific DNA-methyltransferase (cytosine-N(4)-specific) n=1 Tax=Paraconexibacter antarcticus TaxID=2949664 RepID=A0ABY5DYD9_9ACTN|nr:hypothetical protein NBH00_06625 [Paraconexibacter antarcticus]